MEKFVTHTGLPAILWRGNVDTDQIIPKDHLKSIKRTGFGPALFANWRFEADGKTPVANFELNQKHFAGANILITGNNFGCGSSREHAVWAIVQDGYKVVIAPRKGEGFDAIPGFADIFRNNSFKNGLLLIELSEADTIQLKESVEAAPGKTMTVDLANQSIVFGDSKLAFSIDAAVKKKLMGGLDDIGLSLLEDAAISAFEKNHDAQLVRA
jgi:3-isopropylmalate/(R)-2-methylmalate dehydratase small subunit